MESLEETMEPWDVPTLHGKSKNKKKNPLRLSEEVSQEMGGTEGGNQKSVSSGAKSHLGLHCNVMMLRTVRVGFWCEVEWFELPISLPSAIIQQKAIQAPPIRN